MGLPVLSLSGKHYTIRSVASLLAYDPSGGVRTPERFLADGKQALINADGEGVRLDFLTSFM